MEELRSKKDEPKTLYVARITAKLMGKADYLKNIVLHFLESKPDLNDSEHETLHNATLAILAAGTLLQEYLNEKIQKVKHR